MSTLTSHLVYFRFVLFCTFVIQLTHIITSSTFINGELAENETDQVALQAIKLKISSDPQGVLNSWNDSLNFCKWEGITCGRRHRRVIVLDLHSRGLSGYLSPYIGNLSFLRKIYLHGNSIQGEIPDEVGRLFRLDVLFLANNSLVGKIPANLSRCSSLTFLSLGNNKLVGKVPLELVSLYKLQELRIYKNNLTGGISPFIGNLTSLEVITAADNAIEGNIPDSLGRLKKLRILQLGENNLSGKVPLSIYNLSLLDTISLAYNQFHGSLPTNLGLTLPQLQVLEISGNFFGGSIPISLSNASKLTEFEILSNKFSGAVSVNFGGMSHLEYLIIAQNSLGGGEEDEMSFINSLANCSNLVYLEFGDNQFRGALPHSIANLSTTLQALNIQNNRLYGNIPSGIGNLVNIQLLAVGYNQFAGSIPEEIGKLHRLNRMSLSHNQFSGEIPSTMGNLSSLNELYLDNNKLSGVIPSSFRNLKRLEILNVAVNDLIGTIPKEIFDSTYLLVSLYLDQNQLIGSIPLNIGNLKVLSTFSVSYNKLSAEIPTELGLCSGLEYLCMEGNFFHGSIPSSMSSLRGIRSIDLSQNNLSGEIPKFLETLPLENLNLSFNHLEGEVPIRGIFANASAISVAGNTNRLCGGIAALQLPKCPGNYSETQKISPVFIVLISTATAFLGLVFLSILSFCLLRKRRAKHSSESGSTLRKVLLKVSYEMLRNATDGFSSTHLIGVGSFGSVYKGFLDQEGTVVAIKVLNLQRQGASKSFMVECKALRNIRHRNLVKVITSCSSTDFRGHDFKALVYEYMPNGSLERWLHPTPQAETEQPKVLNFTLLQRINIAIDVASALDYLHHNCQEPVLHCDLKPSNVLLDSNMTAHVGDFGLVRFLPEVSNPNQSSSVGVRGTVGYVAPEYGLGSDASTNGDAYSYGILLLELVTRKRPTDPMFEGDLNLHNFSRMSLPDRVMDIVDPLLLNDDLDVAATNFRLMQERNNRRKECLISMVRIGVACSMESPQDRMNITDAANELKLVRNTILQPRIVLNMGDGQS